VAVDFDQISDTITEYGVYIPSGSGIAPSDADPISQAEMNKRRTFRIIIFLIVLSTIVFLAYLTNK
jgi:hypothetical protein